MDRVSPPLDTAPPTRSHLIDLAPLRESPAFAKLWVGNSISGVGAQMTIVAVGLHIYQITGSTFAVSLVGAFALLPMIVFGLYGGMLADAFDRRLVLLVAAIVAWASTITLAALAWTGVEVVWPFYLLTTVNAVAATVIGTVRSAVLPRLLPPRLLPAAAALSGASFGVMVTVGPAIAGVLVATVGFGWTYTVDVLLFLSAFLGIAALPRLAPEGDIHRPGLESLRYGLAFLRTAPNIRMSFVVDTIAMTFGQPRVLFPAAGALVLGGGPVTVGVLTAAGALGALLSSLLSGRVGHRRWHGREITNAILTYGAFIVGFGVVLAILGLGLFGQVAGSVGSPNIAAIVVASVMLAGAGAADNVSSIFRQTMLQTAVPDNMRGRLQGVFTVVVTGGPRVGDIFVGVVAAIGALWLPPLLGGLLILSLLLAVTRLQRGFLRYDALTPTP
ncbi:MFS transporter [Lacisediminihabitans profunda]|uniref:MFS transporter n=1 Tax=Lacisediminihabitans profunda TaxID=2594790 RepID=A0A5C8USA1_9MICO|nr:MFS transporter [Lacisediminihabitans profunda]